MVFLFQTNSFGTCFFTSSLYIQTGQPAEPQYRPPLHSYNPSLPHRQTFNLPVLDCSYSMYRPVEMWWHAQKPDFVFRRNGWVHLIRRGRQFSRLLAAEVCASAVAMLDAPCSEVVWRVLATHCIRQFPLHFPTRASPCAVTFQLESTTRSDFRQICMLPTQRACVHLTLKDTQRYFRKEE